MFGSKNKKVELKPLPPQEFEGEEAEEEQEEYEEPQRPVRRIPQYTPPRQVPRVQEREEKQLSVQDILWNQEQRLQALESWAFRVKNS